MSNRHWPVVLFDLDGTVANTIDLILASYAYATKSVLGREASREESRAWIGQTLIDTFSRLHPEHAERLVETYIDWNLANMDRLVKPYAGMAELLADLHDAQLTVGIVTSKKRHSAEVTLAAVGLDGAVELVGGMEDSATHKPSPEPLLTALNKLGRRADEAVYIGDAWVDLAAADAAGVDGIGVTWGAGLRSELEPQPHRALVDTLDELRALLLD